MPRPAASFCLPPLLLALTVPAPTLAQTSPDDLGSWVAWFWTVPLDDDGRWTLTGDLQHRAWNLGTDKEQDLARGGATWHPSGLPIGFGAGLAHFTNGPPGPGAGPEEIRLHQDLLLAHPLLDDLQLRHRLRLEERWIDDQPVRTRLRYMVAVDIPLNGRTTGRGALYLPVTNEFFVNGETELDGGRTVDRFDRNWIFVGLGAGVSASTRIQLSWLGQTTAERTRHHLVLAVVSRF